MDGLAQQENVHKVIIEHDVIIGIYVYARMEKIRKYADIYGDKREFFGALAATVVNEK
ncbi:hypothetical protein FACS1894109_21760 [Spirochaetia bacterium]|nr:hypothetical protein FACS1894109_21760 [Spirochaetia bacterium]